MSPTLPPASIPATVKEYCIPCARSDTVLLVALSVTLITSGSRDTLAAMIVMVYMAGGQLVSLVGGGFQDNSTEFADIADEVTSTGALGVLAARSFHLYVYMYYKLIDLYT